MHRLLVLLIIATLAFLGTNAHAEEAKIAVEAGRLADASRLYEIQFASAKSPQERGDTLQAWAAMERMQRGDFAAYERVVSLATTADIGASHKQIISRMDAASSPSPQAVATLPKVVASSGDWRAVGSAAVHDASGLACDIEIPDWAVTALVVGRSQNPDRDVFTCSYGNPNQGVLVSVAPIKAGEDAKSAMTAAFGAFIDKWRIAGGVSLTNSILSLETPGDLAPCYAAMIGENQAGSSDFRGAGGVILTVRGKWAVAVGITTSPKMFGFAAQTLAPALARHFIRTIKS